MFRVILHKRIGQLGGVKNPFLVRDIFNPQLRVTTLNREWEVEASSEAEVMRYLHDAREADLEQVRGFELRSIEELPHQTPGERS